MTTYILLREEGVWVIVKQTADSEDFVAAFADKHEASEYLYQMQSTVGACEEYDQAGDR
jgi:hypothetical protein